MLSQSINESIIKQLRFDIPFQMGNVFNYINISSVHISEINLESLEIFGFYHHQYKIHIG